MGPKPGWKTTEFWAMAVTFVIHLLVVAGFVPESDSEGLAANATAALVNVGAIIAYVMSRAYVKASATPDPKIMINKYREDLKKQTAAAKATLARHEKELSELIADAD